MNKICVYAIAKNESKNVQEWVKSMSPADHIIVLDTGSTDNTVSLLKRLGVEVHQKQYEHFRFDTARNDSLDLIPDEYNIRVCTDLDERFSNSDWAKILKENWDENKPRVVYSYVWSHTSDGLPGLQFDINKIHGIDPNLRWKGAVHEHLTFMKENTRQFTKFIDLRNQIVLHHYSDLTKPRKFYIQLMEERVKDDPLDKESYILLGNEYRVKGAPEKAIQCYIDAIKLYKQDKEDDVGRLILLPGIYYALGNSYYKSKQLPEAMSAYIQGIAANKTYRDNYYGLSVIYYENQMYHAAIGFLNQALETTFQKHCWLEDGSLWTFVIYDLLGACHAQLKEWDKGLSYAQIALQYESNNKILIEHYQYYLKEVENQRGNVKNDIGKLLCRN